MYKSNIDEVIKTLEQKTHITAVAVGEFVKSEAKLRAPNDLGNLIAGIGYMIEKTGKNTNVIIGSQAEYSIYVEKGTGVHAEDGNGRLTPWAYEDREGNTVWTVGQEPQPFLRPAVEGNINRINSIIKKHLGK